MDLSYANLSRANLEGAALTYADLMFTNLQGADMTDAGLAGNNRWNTTCPDGTKNDGALPCTAEQLNLA